MAGFFSRLFGNGKKGNDVKSTIEETVEGIIKYGNFDLSFDVAISTENESSTAVVNFSGPDEEILTDRKGQLLDAIQLFIKRVLQHSFSDDKTNVVVDCGGYRNESEQALIERAENLKNIVIEQSKAVYYRALPPKERKVVHQYLSKDPRVKSRSMGDGLYKKIKIFPAKSSQQNSYSDEIAND